MAPLTSFLRSARRPAFRVREPAERPDIVLFLTDEQRHDRVGYASGGHYETPVLDRLADEGVRFDAAYSGSTTCVPSRVCLLTGVHHHRVPHAPNGLALAEGYWTLARGLAAVGYATALVGKMHFFPMYADHGFERMHLAEHLVPFSGYRPGEIDDYHRFLLWRGQAGHGNTHMFGAGLDAERGDFLGQHFALPFAGDRSCHPVDWVAETSREVISGRRPGAPLFLVVSFPRPHAPYDPPEPYASMYDVSEARVPPGDGAPHLALPPALRDAFEVREENVFNPCPVSSLPPDVVRRVLTYERALIRQIDDAVGSVLEQLDPARTVVFFTSDHGTFGGHRGLMSKVPWIPFDDLAKVPFVCRAPGVMAGRRIAEPVQTMDFVPTCLDYAGVVPPEGVMDAVSLRSVIEGYPAPRDRIVFSSGSQGYPMAREGTLKVIRSGDTDVAFDLKEDPGERYPIDVEGSHHLPVARLRAHISAMMSRPMADLPVVTPRSRTA